MRKAVTIIALLISISLVYSLVSIAVTRNQAGLTDTAQNNTFRNSFVSGCKEEAVKILNEAEAQEYCTCGYNSMVELYPDFSTNEERMNRIIASGYNQTETDTVVKCLPESAKE